MTSTTRSRGVYFLANDRVIDLAIAFLNSFRCHNPDVPLCLIPFAEDVENLIKLKETYRFSLFGDLALLQKCDAVSRQFHGKTFGHYRKLAAWHGRFDQFIYIDIDTVVLQSLLFLFPFIDHYSFVACNSDWEPLIQWVWRDSIYAAKKLTQTQIGFAANTGFICSHRGALSLEQTEAVLPQALDLKEHMNLDCLDQPLLNYLIVTSDLERTSIRLLQKGNPELKLPGAEWAGTRGGKVRQGQITFKQRSNILFVHWAGLHAPTDFDKFIFKLSVKLGLMKPPAIRMRLQYRRLWEFYRNMEPPATGRVAESQDQFKA